MILTLTWLAVAIATLALYLHRVYSRYSRAGINCLPIVPIFGHVFWVFMKREHMIECLMRSINAFPEDRIVGHFEVLKPVTLIRDPELLKRISIKDFEHFGDRRSFSGKHDPMFGRGVFMLGGDEWKSMRSTLSPTFTSSKLRLMVPFMEEVGAGMIKALKHKIKDSGNSYVDVEAKNLLSRYTNDVIASCLFGLKINSHTNDNYFYVRSKDMTSLSIPQFVKISLFRNFPTFFEMFNIKVVSRKNENYLINMILNNMKHRDEENIVRSDLINILMELKKGQQKQEKEKVKTGADFAKPDASPLGKKLQNFEWTDSDLVAQGALFLFAGYETISTMMTFLLHELAINPEVQERLVQEIQEYDLKNGGKLDFNAVQSMPYLDMVVSEGLRMWPVAPQFDRCCTKDYNMGKPNSKATKDFILRKGDVVVVPIWAFHRNPELFPNPQKFDPERFSPENKDKIKPYTYIPFGSGPRICIAFRFAIFEIKMMVCQLLRDMKLSACEKTNIPAQLEGGFIFRMKGGAWIRISVRE